MSAALVAAAQAHAADAPTQAAVVVDDGEARDRACVLAEARRLAKRLDDVTSSGATVLVRGVSGPGFHAAALAVLGTGRRVLPVPSSAPVSDLEACADTVKISAVIEHDGRSSPPFAAVPVIEATFERGAEGCLDRGAQGSLLLLSSGTTGRPRIVLREARALDRVAHTLVGLLGLRPSDTIVSALPMQHSYGFEHGFLAPIASGAAVRVVAGLVSNRVETALRDGGTVLPAVPAMLDVLAGATQCAGLRLVYSAGAPLPESVRDRFEIRWGVAVHDLYGASEVGTITFTQRGAARSVPGVELRVCDPEIAEHLVDLAPGDPGEVCVRSDAMFAGYLAPDGGIDRDRIVDGFFRTGDLGALDPDRSLRLLGRLKLQLDVGGLKVDPEAVEAVLMGHPLVREALVGPLPVSATVCRLQAHIVPRRAAGPGDAEDIRRFARERLARHAVPRTIEFRDALPRSASGKLLRGRL